QPVGAAAEALVSLRVRLASAAGTAYVYGVADVAAGPRLVGNVVAGDSRRALAHVAAADFDPATTAFVAAAKASTREGPAGSVRRQATGHEQWTYRTHSAAAGVLVTERAYLSHYLATLDGEPVETEVVNVGLLGVSIPAGDHEVEIWVDRGPFTLSLLGTALGIAVLGWLSRRPDSGSHERLEIVADAPRRGD
ncbi:MAG: hypothetical protein VYE73_14855, partial [Acidobacteriota bacterium]|nr:hypothetical protein [Acidobacteriota bacterium]